MGRKLNDRSELMKLNDLDALTVSEVGEEIVRYLDANRIEYHWLSDKPAELSGVSQESWWDATQKFRWLLVFPTGGSNEGSQIHVYAADPSGPGGKIGKNIPLFTLKVLGDMAHAREVTGIVQILLGVG